MEVDCYGEMKSGSESVTTKHVDLRSKGFKENWKFNIINYWELENEKDSILYIDIAAD